MIGLVLSVFLWTGSALVAEVEAPGPEAERLRTAKALFFDRRYDEAREAWKAVLDRATGAQAATAAYWVARCSESLGQAERAFAEYGQFLERNGADGTLREEARTSRAALAARLVKQGREEFRLPLRKALKDPSTSVRYFAAVQLAMLGDCGGGVVSILRHVVASESDDELVQRARLGLLRCDPRSLEGRSRPRPAPSSRAGTRWVNLRIYEKPGARAKIAVNVPVSLAEILFKSLPEESKKELRLKGYDAENFWERLNRLPRGQILEIVGEDGGRIQVWIE